MGVAHHSAYAPWLEMGRTELLRQRGYAYRDFEGRGIFLAVTSLSIRYKRPARYDDVLEIHTSITDIGHVKIDHSYEVKRDGQLLATAATTLACLDRDGRPRLLPPELTGKDSS
jgi:acyl-CoA thioester hydrolase